MPTRGRRSAYASSVSVAQMPAVSELGVPPALSAARKSSISFFARRSNRSHVLLRQARADEAEAGLVTGASSTSPAA